MEKITNWFKNLSKTKTILLGVLILFIAAACKSSVNDSIDKKCNNLNYNYTLNEMDEDASDSVASGYMMIFGIVLIGYGICKPRKKKAIEEDNK